MRSPPHKWTEAEVARMQALRDRGLSNMAIAKVLGLTLKQIHNKFAHGVHVTRQPRPCMCCKRTFTSEGKHNRLCRSCKEIHA